MSGLQTGWLNISREGLTVDRREIFAQDLIDMAETYDPDIYSAQINYSHYSSWRMGKVLELKTITDKSGKIRLQARLAPNIELCKMNAAQQAVHFSIEICKDFQGSGKSYLDGLAVLDDPASTGTSELQLFGKNNDNSNLGNIETITFFDDESITEHFLKSASKKNENKPFSFAEMFKNKFSNKSPEDEGEDEMTKDQQEAIIAGMGTAFSAALQPLADELKGLGEQFNKFGEGEEPETPPGTTEKPPVDAVTAEQFAKLQADHEALQEKFNKAEHFTKDDDDFSDDDTVEGVI
jgi:hypothetical protein